MKPLSSVLRWRTEVTTRNRLTLWGAAATALVGVFYLYTQPDFLVQLANQVWACF